MRRLIFGATAFMLFTTAGALAQESVLSDKMYVDPKGFFKVVPPRGWFINEYTVDPRGKVDFDVTPGPLMAQLKVVGQVSTFGDIDAVMRECEATAERFRQRYAATSRCERIAFEGQTAIRGITELAGKLKNETTQVLFGKNCYTFSYGARPELFDKYHALVSKSIETFEPLLKERPKDDAARQAAASAIRRANLYIQMGREDWALTAIEEGLVHSPGNKELLELKKRVEKMP